MSFTRRFILWTFNLFMTFLRLTSSRFLASPRISLHVTRLRLLIKQQAVLYLNYAAHSPEFVEDSYNEKDYVDFTSIEQNDDQDYYFLDDIPVMIEMPKRKSQRTVVQHPDDDCPPLFMLPVTPVRYQYSHDEDSETTCLMDSASTKQYNLHFYDPKYLTPVRYRDSIRDREVTFTLLKEASNRVTEILRENRRRLDAGEDPCTVRRELRRRRAQELSARRKARSPYA